MKKKGLYFLFLLGFSFYFLHTPSRNVVKMPVFFTTKPYRPFVKPQVEGKKYRFLVDLGSCQSLIMSKTTLAQISKVKQDATIQTLDFKGNRYTSSIYQIPEFKIGSLVCQQCNITEEDDNFQRNAGLWAPSNSKSPDGKIGWSFFDNHCVLFDFPNSSIIVSNNLEDFIKNKRLNLNHFHKIPITLKNGLLTTKIETDFGIFEAIFDTGSALPILRQSKIPPESILYNPAGHSYVSINTVLINGCDFKDWRFAVADFSELLEIDGILGMDFFLEHAICFDLPNKTAYIQKPGSYLSMQWQIGKFHVTQFFLRKFEKWGIL